MIGCLGRRNDRIKGKNELIEKVWLKEGIDECEKYGWNGGSEGRLDGKINEREVQADG